MGRRNCLPGSARLGFDTVLSIALKNLGKALATAIAMAMLPATAHAAPGATEDQTTGAAVAQVIGPFQIAPIADLRFGSIMQPATPGNVTISSAGVVTTTLTFSATSGPRGPAIFVITGEPNRRFLVQLPAPIDISNGTSTMRVDQFRANTAASGQVNFSSTGFYVLNVGGRLRVNANQEPGSYTGTFDVTVLYQ